MKYFNKKYLDQAYKKLKYAVRLKKVLFECKNCGYMSEFMMYGCPFCDSNKRNY